MCHVSAPYTGWMRRVSPLLLASLALGCFGGGGGTPSPGPAFDPVRGPECPARHLSVAARPILSDGTSLLVRFTEDLEQCQGLVVSEELDDTLWDLGGMSDGSDLLGFDGRVMRVRGREVLWDVEAAGRVLDVFPLTVARTEHVAVLWGSATGSSPSGDRLEVLDAGTGETLATYDVSFDVVAAAASEREDRVVLLDRYDGFAEHVVDLSAEALGGAGELEVAAPGGTGSLGSVLVRAGRVDVVGSAGVLRWTPDTPSMLGPSSCRWSYWEGETLPEECEFRGLAADPTDEARWLTLCHAPDREGALVSLGPRDSCAVLLPEPRLPDHEITDLAWSGG